MLLGIIFRVIYLINPGTTLSIGANVFLFAGTTFTNNGTLTAPTSGRFIFYGAGTLLQKNEQNNNKTKTIPGIDSKASLFVDEESIPSSIKEIINNNPKSINVSPQTYTGAGVMTAPLYSIEFQNTAGVAITAANQQVVGRVILFEGSVTGCDKLTLGNGGTTTGTVQIGNGTTLTLAGTFDAPFTFNLGTGGEVLYYLRTGSSRTDWGRSQYRTCTHFTYIR